MRHKRDMKPLNIETIADQINAQFERDKRPNNDEKVVRKRVDWTARGSRLPEHMHTPW